MVITLTNCQASHAAALQVQSSIVEPVRSQLEQLIPLRSRHDYYCLHDLNSLSKLESSGRTQRANEKHVSIGGLKGFRCFLSFTKHLCLFALEVLFALSCERKSSPVVSRLCITTLKPCHWFISPEIKVTLMCAIQSHSFLTPAVQAARQLYCCTVQLFNVLSFVGVRSIYQYSFL